MQNELIYYPRKPDGSPFACILATKDKDDKIRIGWSMCSKEDTFSKQRAKQIARGRALVPNESFSCPVPYPQKLSPYVSYMEKRAQHYYKKYVIM